MKLVEDLWPSSKTSIIKYLINIYGFPFLDIFIGVFLGECGG